MILRLQLIGLATRGHQRYKVGRKRQQVRVNNKMWVPVTNKKMVQMCQRRRRKGTVHHKISVFCLQPEEKSESLRNAQSLG